MPGLYFPAKLCEFCKTHIGAGIDEEDAVKLNLPKEDYRPRTLEQKIVSYADNLVSGNKILTFKETLKIWEGKYGFESKPVKRLILEHEELTNFITREQMIFIDQTAIKNGITSKTLMQSAGREVARITEEVFRPKHKRIVIFAGSGNNGGDALVAAINLKKTENKVTVLQFGNPKSENTKDALEQVKKNNIPIKQIKTINDFACISGDFAIDGLLGIGILGEVREPIKSGIVCINNFPKKISIDIPSGLDPDTGHKSSPTVNPDLIITIHRFKKGLVGKYKTGVVRIADIGLPKI